jgi:uncharacterized protein YggE
MTGTKVRISLLALAAAVLTPALLTAQLPATPPPERTVIVNATASIEREPERAQVLLAVESQATSAQQAAAANATKMDAVLAALRRAGIPAQNIRTVSYSLQPEYSRSGRDDPQRPPVITSYRAINMVQVTVEPVTKAGEIIDVALKAGANRVHNLSFELKDPDAAHRDALRAAVTKAQLEAQTMAEAAGQRLGPPLQMTSGGYAIPRYARDMAVAEVAMAQAPPTPVEPGLLTIMASVTITYRLEPR